jgi:hypothetical protein
MIMAPMTVAVESVRIPPAAITEEKQHRPEGGLLGPAVTRRQVQVFAKVLQGTALAVRKDPAAQVAEHAPSISADAYPASQGHGIYPRGALRRNSLCSLA